MGIYFKNKFYEIKRKLFSLLIVDSNEFSKEDFLLICSDNDKSDCLNSQSYSRILDTLYDDLKLRGYNCKNIAVPYSLKVKDKSWGNPLSFNRLYFKSKICQKLLLVLNSLFFIQRNASLPIVNYYQSILNRFNPKVVFVIGCVPELAIAGFLENVTIVEVLHGFGYSNIPWGWDRLSKEQLPSAIISFDSVSTLTFSSLKSKNVKIYEIESLWKNRFKIFYSEKLPEEWQSFSNKTLSNKKNILFPLTWGYADDHIDRNEFSNILENGLFPESIIRLVEKTQKNVNWLFRLHPKHLNNTSLYFRHFQLLSDLKNKYENIEWEIASKIPLPILLESVSGVISMSTMVPYEAADFGIRSLVICPTIKIPGIYPDFKDLIANGFVEYADFNDETSIFDWVVNIDKVKKFETKYKDEWDDVVKDLIK
jgi:hypothetical protein